MPRRSGVSSRQTALERALAATAARDAERLRRERSTQEALAGFFLAQESAQKIREAARIKAEKVLAEAEASANEFDVAAARAVGQLVELGESRGGIAELTGLTGSQVRQALADASSARPRPTHVVTTPDTSTSR
jgi:hypothetical protein